MERGWGQQVTHISHLHTYSFSSQHISWHLGCKACYCPRTASSKAHLELLSAQVSRKSKNLGGFWNFYDPGHQLLLLDQSMMGLTLLWPGLGTCCAPWVTPSTTRRKIIWHLMVMAPSPCGCDPVSDKWTHVSAPTVLGWSTKMWLPADSQNPDAGSIKRSVSGMNPRSTKESHPQDSSSQKPLSPKSPFPPLLSALDLTTGCLVLCRPKILSVPPEVSRKTSALHYGSVLAFSHP